MVCTSHKYVCNNQLILPWHFAHTENAHGLYGMLPTSNVPCVTVFVSHLVSHMYKIFYLIATYNSPMLKNYYIPHFHHKDLFEICHFFVLDHTTYIYFFLRWRNKFAVLIIRWSSMADPAWHASRWMWQRQRPQQWWRRRQQPSPLPIEAGQQHTNLRSLITSIIQVIFSNISCILFCWTTFKSYYKECIT